MQAPQLPQTLPQNPLGAPLQDPMLIQQLQRNPALMQHLQLQQVQRMGRPMPMGNMPDVQYGPQWMPRPDGGMPGQGTPQIPPAAPAIPVGAPGTTAQSPVLPGTPTIPGTPAIPPSTPNMPTPSLPNAPAPQAPTVPLSGQRNFATVVQSFMIQRGLVLPPDWPAGFSAPSATNPAEVRTIDPATLFAKVTSVGGSERVFGVPGGWSFIAAQLELAVGPPGEMSAPGALPKPGEVPGRLAAYYSQRLALFEQSWMAARRSNDAGASAATQVPKQPIIQVRPNESHGTPAPSTPVTPATEEPRQPDRTHIQLVLQQQVAHLQQLLANEQITPQQAAARYSALQSQLMGAGGGQGIQPVPAPAPPSMSPAPPGPRATQTPSTTPSTPAVPAARAETASPAADRGTNTIPGIPFANVAQEQLRGNPAAIQALQMLKNGTLNPMQQQVAVTIIRAAMSQSDHDQTHGTMPSSAPAPASTVMSSSMPAPAVPASVPGQTQQPSVPVNAVPTPVMPTKPDPSPSPAEMPSPAARSASSSVAAPSPAPAAASTPTAAPAPASEKLKIEYMPWCIDLQTFGGRDLARIDNELLPAQATASRVRGVADLGTVDIFALSMALRSRVEFEVSYALNTLLVLTSGVDAPPSFQLPLALCEDLLDELLVLLVETAFAIDTDAAERIVSEPCTGTQAVHETGLLSVDMVTYSDAIDLALQDESEMRILRRKCGASSDEKRAERRAQVALTVMAILRNAALMSDNSDYLANHPRFLKVVATVARAAEKDPRVSRATDADAPLGHLTLRETLRIRKDVLGIVLGVSGESLSFERHGPLTIASLFDVLRFFVLDASVIEERHGANVLLEPVAAGMRVNFQAYQAPYHASVALQALSRFLLLDSNRENIAGWLPPHALEQIVGELVRLLPVSEIDFRRLGSQPRLEYLEGAALSLYALVYLASPALKSKLRARPSTTRVIFTTVRRLLATSRDYERNPYSLLCRRLVETLRLLSDAQDMFGDPPLLGMYWPALDEDNIDDNASGAGAAQAGVLVGQDAVVFDTLQQTQNVEHTVADELLDLMSVRG